VFVCVCVCFEVMCVHVGEYVEVMCVCVCVHVEVICVCGVCVYACMLR
jgi:hypothetical protein